MHRSAQVEVYTAAGCQRIVFTQERLVVVRQRYAIIRYTKDLGLTSIHESGSVFVMYFDHLGIVPQAGSGLWVILTPVNHRPITQNLEASAIHKVKALVFIGYSDQAARIIKDGRLTGITEILWASSQ